MPLSGIRVIKAYGAEVREQERFETDSRGAFREAFRARGLFAAFSVAIFGVLGTAAIVAIALATLKARDAVPMKTVQRACSPGHPWPSVLLRG